MKRRTLLNLLSRGTASLIIAGMAGCVTRPESAVDDAALPPGHGFLVLEISANMDDGQLSAIKYTGAMGNAEIISENVMGPEFALKVRGHYKFWVIPVLAGDYSWSRYTMFGKFAILHKTSRFSVTAGQLNYVGSIDLYGDGRGISLSVRDGEASVRRSLAEKYPLLSSKYLFVKRLTEIKAD